MGWNEEKVVELKGVTDKVTIGEDVWKVSEWLCELFPNHEWHLRMFGTVEEMDSLRKHFHVQKWLITKQVVSGASVETPEDEETEEEARREIEAFEKKTGLAYLGVFHSHNNMGVFFSGTDDEDLMSYNLGLVRNNRGEVYGKSCEHKDGYAIVKELEIEIEGQENEIPEWFKKIVEEKIKKIEIKKYEKEFQINDADYGYYKREQRDFYSNNWDEEDAMYWDDDQRFRWELELARDRIKDAGYARICPYCGSVMENEEKYCPYCGAETVKIFDVSEAREILKNLFGEVVENDV